MQQYTVDTGNAKWLYRLRIEGAAGHTVRLHGVPMPPIPSDDYYLDFTRILDDIYTLELNYREHLDLVEARRYDDAERHRQANPHVSQTHQIFLIIANNLTPGFDENFPRSKPTDVSWRGLNLGRCHEITIDALADLPLSNAIRTTVLPPL